MGRKDRDRVSGVSGVSGDAGGGSSLGDLLRAKGLTPSAPVEVPEIAVERPQAPPKATKPAGTPKPPPPTGSGPKIVLRRTRAGRAGKTVTLVQGLPGDADEHAKRLKKSLGTGATVEDDGIAVHGDQVDRLETLLRGWGYERIVRGS